MDIGSFDEKEYKIEKVPVLTATSNMLQVLHDYSKSVNHFNNDIKFEGTYVTWPSTWPDTSIPYPPKFYPYDDSYRISQLERQVAELKEKLEVYEEKERCENRRTFNYEVDDVLHIRHSSGHIYVIYKGVTFSKKKGSIKSFYEFLNFETLEDPEILEVYRAGKLIQKF